MIQPKSHSSFHFLAGLCSGVSSAVLLQPADLLKTRVQQSRQTALLPTLRAILASPQPFRGLWRGTVPSALRTGFGSALYFTSLNALRRTLANARAREASSLSLANVVLPGSSSVLPRLSDTQNLATGAIARVAAGTVMMPVTVIKVRYESTFYSYRSLWGAVRDIVGKEGVKGFFSGTGATAVRDAPYAGLYVLFYEKSKQRFNSLAGIKAERAKSQGGGSSDRGSTTSAATINFVSGVFAAGLATAITNPFDAVKTRLQLLPARYGNMLHATKLMLKEDGIRSFLDGLGIRMARKALSSALAWTVYEELISRAEKRWEENRKADNFM